MTLDQMERGFHDEQDLFLIDVEGAVERMGDTETYLEIARYFAAHLPVSLALLGEALEKGDLAKARRLAHSMKSNCATVGAEALRQRCLALEKLCEEGSLAAARHLFGVFRLQMMTLKARLEEQDSRSR